MNRKMYCGALLTVCSLFLSIACASNGNDAVSEDIPRCETREDVARLAGKKVLIVGYMQEGDAGKTIVTYIDLVDGGGIVYRYRRMTDKRSNHTGGRRLVSLGCFMNPIPRLMSRCKHFWPRTSRT